MAIEDLRALVSAPPALRDALELGAWADIERAVGTKLPADYRAFGINYGSGQFDDGTYAFWVINPLSPNYLAQLAVELDLWRVRREAFPDEYPADIFPARPGLLPWGRDEDGGMMGWLIEGSDPTQWAVIAKNTNEPFERFELSLTDFLARSLSHRIRPRVWRPDYPGDISKVVFQPQTT